MPHHPVVEMGDALYLGQGHHGSLDAHKEIHDGSGEHELGPHIRMDLPQFALGRVPDVDEKDHHGYDHGHTVHDGNDLEPCGHRHLEEVVGADVGIDYEQGPESQKGEERDKIADEFGVQVLGVQLDVTKPADIDRAREEILTGFGGLDILINNAGTGSEETIAEAEDERWYYYWDLHVMAAVRTARAFIPGMKERGGGVILNTASICAKQPLWYEPIYNTTKAALVMFGKCLADEVIGSNIRVNTIRPCAVWDQPPSGSEKEALDIRLGEMIPMGRIARPADVAWAAVFLASDKAEYITGQCLNVDGGMLEQSRPPELELEPVVGPDNLISKGEPA